MERPECLTPIAPRLRNWLALSIVLSAPLCIARAEPPFIDDTPTPASSRIDRLEHTLQSVVDENRRLAEQVRSLREQSLVSAPDDEAPDDWLAPPAEEQFYYENASQTGYSVGYDNGFVIRPDDPDASPFSLKVNNQTTFRYTGFAHGAATWVDSAGNVNPIFNSSNFNIPRGRLILSGNALLPELSYLLNIDYNTVSSNPIGFRAYALGYRFGRALEFYVGQNKVPGSREWLASSFDSQEGPDRSMASTFFRPSLSQGFWFKGEPFDGVHYHAMVSNGFNTINRTPTQLDNRYCFSESVWWEPWGEFGRGYSAVEMPEQAVIRLGSSFTFSIEEGSQTSDYPENAALRLSDGTLLTQPGAFAPGVTLQRFNLSLAAFDLALKYRRCSLASEMYFQDLSSLRGTGPLPISSTRASGGFLQGGWFLCPQKVELYSRTSYVTGQYGSGTEIAGGFNWFVLEGKSNLRFTCDAAWLDSSPADQNRTGFVAGQTGLLIRTQITSSF